MNDVIHMVLIRFIDLFTFSHGSNRNKQWGCVTLMWIAVLSCVIDFDVVEQYSDVGFFLQNDHV